MLPTRSNTFFDTLGATGFRTAMIAVSHLEPFIGVQQTFGVDESTSSWSLRTA